MDAADVRRVRVGLSEAVRRNPRRNPITLVLGSASVLRLPSGLRRAWSTRSESQDRDSLDQVGSERSGNAFFPTQFRLEVDLLGPNFEADCA